MHGRLPELTELQERMLVVAERLQPGEVINFGDLAAAAGNPRAARAAGSLLSRGEAFDLPWWRVVYADGRLPPCNPGLQAERLADEGVELSGFRVIRSPKGRFARGANR